MSREPVRDVIRLDLRFVSVLRHLEWRDHDSGAVDLAVQGGLLGENFDSGGDDGAEAGQVNLQNLDSVV